MKNIIRVAGLLHFCQIPAMVVAPRMLGWKKDLMQLQPINLRIVQVMGVAIMITVIGLGVVVMIGAQDIADGTPLGLGLACFLGVFWFLRGTAQLLLYRRIWPAGVMGRLSHYGLIVLFYFLSTVYFTGWIKGLS